MRPSQRYKVLDELLTASSNRISISRAASDGATSGKVASQRRGLTQEGVTLIELMVSMAIMALLVTIAYPHVMSWLAKSEANRIHRSLTSTLTQAKADSYIHRNDVIVCVTNQHGSCHRDGDNSLLLFIDSNGNHDYDSTVDKLLYREDLKLRFGQVKLRVGARRHYVKFFGNTGTPRGYFGHIKYCPASADPNHTFQVSFNQQGIIKYKPSHHHPTGC